MIQSYLPVVILLGVTIVFLVASFIASILLGPKRRTMAKTASYECGIISDDEMPQRFGVKFYIIAIAFILLDVEIIFLYPFSTVFVDKIVDGVQIEGLGAPGLAAMGIFLFILLLPFAYLLSSGALNFGPKTPKMSEALKPIIRSQGFISSVNKDVSGSKRAFAASDETTGSARPEQSEGRETASGEPIASLKNDETKLSEGDDA